MNNNNDNRNHNSDKSENTVQKNTAVPDYEAAKQLGIEVKYLQSNEELREDGMVEDPIQETPEHAEIAADKETNVKLKKAEDNE
ncbi:hypothetical protein [Aneurinibacillus tyrosinisolvens]|uniref:hypothetical protein n=1 Tax=Aneurinibacillus tyrosinisolvens TaxID=1443435 RepID=UPI00063F784F|nr:hypothetical protein [Aneurinibacillus tyrosinisolvens]